MEYYNKKKEQILNELAVKEDTGLSTEAANELLKKYGPNELKEEKKKSVFQKVIDQFKDPMLIILIVASLISIFIGEVQDAMIILAIVVVNAILSISQEGKAEKAIEALKKMSAPNAKVLRDGKIIELPSPKIVIGDIVLLETGSIVPADMRLIESTNLKIDESSFTGESVPVEKYADTVYEDKREIGDRENMAFSSTIVTYGRGIGVVTATGTETEIGHIAKRVSEVEDEQTPLQKKLAQLSKTLGIIVIGVCAVVFIVGKLHNLETLQLFMTTISLGVAAIPEGLPAIVTIVLSLGMGRMADKNAIVKKLLAVETLGTTTVICSDKTGTLTQNEMTVVKAYVNNTEIEVTGSGYAPIGEFKLNGKKIEAKDLKGLDEMLEIATLTNDAKLNSEKDNISMIGDPTEGALLTLSGKAGYTKEDLEEKYPRVDEIPFDSKRKMMTTFHENFHNYKVVSFTKGAPDIIIENCSKIFLDGEIKELSDQLKSELLNKNKEFASSALRVLAYAFRNYEKMPEEKTTENIENNMIFVGITGMIDPPREEVKDAIKECKSAGIIPIMITGDYLDTAFAIAKDLGIATKETEAIMGKELNLMTEEEIRKIVKEKKVFARVSPENKVQIVSALRSNGHIAAMTGDGVNDAPAIKQADIGIAMGITGTDVAKSTAELILTDDNFATIVHAVEEGRIIYSNIKKFVSFLLSCNIGEILIMLVAIIMNLPIPLLPKQLLWLNLVTDSFPALALGVEKGEDDIMERPPRRIDEPILDKNMLWGVSLQAIAITIGSMVAFMWGLKAYPNSITHARTIMFVTLITAELLRSYSSRSSRYTLLHMGIFTNKRLVQATLLSLGMMLAVVYIPPLQGIFDTFSLGVKDWMIIAPCSLLPILAGEIYKAIRFKKENRTHKR
ncbi:MAG: calcium-translocating P-type ATPase, SERCA-type [Tissierellia bacterium]|nr:calcium-translocating P-type ATPase, SERCA-type [Tissierellia bacterium]